MSFGNLSLRPKGSGGEDLSFHMLRAKKSISPGWSAMSKKWAPSLCSSDMGKDAAVKSLEGLQASPTERLPLP